MLLVFLSGIGFSLQTLTVKKLEEISDYKSSFQLIVARGTVQSMISWWFIKKYNTTTNTEIFGPTPFVRKMLLIRSIVGFGGIANAFLALERLPIGDSTVLLMMSPIFSTALSFFILGEAWRFPEFLATIMSITGVIFVAQPEFIFGTSTTARALDPIGVTFGLCAAISAGAAYTCVRVLGTTAKMPWYNVCLAQGLGQVIFSIPFMFLFPENHYYPTFMEIIVIISTGFLGSWSQIAMTVGMQREKSATATGMRMSDVFFGFIWQVLFTNDSHISGFSILGAILVMGSIFVLIFGKPKTDDILITKDFQSKGIGSIGIEMNNKSGNSNSNSNSDSNSGQTYNVLHMNDVDVDADMDSSRGQTAIDVSLHDSNFNIKSDGDDDGEIFLGIDEIGNGGNAFGGEGVRKRQGSLSSDPDISVDDMKERLRIAIVNE